MNAGNLCGPKTDQHFCLFFVFLNRNLRNLLLEGNTIETLPLELGKLTNNNYFIYHTCINLTGKHVNNCHVQLVYRQ